MSSWETKSVDECPVYVDDESPFRFMPPLPAFEGLPRGWFMLQDLVNALPLSVFALLVRMKCRVRFSSCFAFNSFSLISRCGIGSEKYIV